MNIKLISKDDYIKSFGVPDWSGVDYDDSVYLFTNSNNKIIADCVLFIEQNSVEIDNFEVRYKGQGYGRKCIDMLKNNYGKLTGGSILESLGFWAKMGALFNSDDLAKIPDDENVTYNELIRFSIN